MDQTTIEHGELTMSGKVIGKSRIMTPEQLRLYTLYRNKNA